MQTLRSPLNIELNLNTPELGNKVSCFPDILCQSSHQLAGDSCGAGEFSRDLHSIIANATKDKFAPTCIANMHHASSAIWWKLHSTIIHSSKPYRRNSLLGY